MLFSTSPDNIRFFSSESHTRCESIERSTRTVLRSIWRCAEQRAKMISAIPFYGIETTRKKYYLHFQCVRRQLIRSESHHGSQSIAAGIRAIQQMLRLSFMCSYLFHDFAGCAVSAMRGRLLCLPCGYFIWMICCTTFRVIYSTV